MNRACFQANLLKAVSETLENTVFAAIVEVPLAEVALDPGAWCVAKLEVEEPLAGTVHLALPMRFAAELTMQIFCLDEAPGEKQVRDIAAELLNTAAGRLMAFSLPQDRAFKLGLPRTEVGEREALWSVPETKAYDVDGQYFLFAVDNSLIPA